jgi:hypothetical protein
MFQRPQYRPTTSAGRRDGSVVNRYSSRWVPSRSETNTQRTGTSPRPDLYQCPEQLTAPTRRVPPPCQGTVSRVRDRSASHATAWRGLGSLLPFTRGRPSPEYGGGGLNRLASGQNLLTSVGLPLWRWQKRATSWLP